MVCGPGQLSMVCNQKKKTQILTETNRKRKSCVLELCIAEYSKQYSDQSDLNTIKLLKCGFFFFQERSIFLPAISPHCSSLSSVLCQALSAFSVLFCPVLCL